MTSTELGPLREALNLRLLGAVFWQFLGVSAIHVAWSLLQGVFVSAPGLMKFALVYATNVLVLLALHLAASTSEAVPLILPRFGFTYRSKLSLAVARLLLRGRSLKDVAVASAFHLACLFSAGAYAYLYGDGSGWASLLGRVTAVSFSSCYLLSCLDVLKFPVVQRRRYWRVKSCYPAVVSTALRVNAVSTAISLVLAIWNPASRPASARQAILGATSSVLCTLCWAYTAQVVSIVMSERLGYFKGDLDAVMAGLRQPDSTIQDLALLELATAVEDNSAAGQQLRAAMFADVSGERYLLPLINFGLGTVNDVISVAAKPLKASTGEAPATNGAVSWNQPRAAPFLKAATSSDHDAVHWRLNSSIQRLSLCVRYISAVAAASRAEDRYGVLLQANPGLLDVLGSLVSCLLVLQLHQKNLVRAPAGEVLPSFLQLQPRGSLVRPGTRVLDPVAAALEDVVGQAVARLTHTFGDTPQQLLQGLSKAAVPYGSAIQLQDALKPFL